MDVMAMYYGYMSALDISITRKCGLQLRRTMNQRPRGSYHHMTFTINRGSPYSPVITAATQSLLSTYILWLHITLWSRETQHSASCWLKAAVHWGLPHCARWDERHWKSGRLHSCGLHGPCSLMTNYGRVWGPPFKLWKLSWTIAGVSFLRRRACRFRKVLELSSRPWLRGNFIETLV